MGGSGVRLILWGEVVEEEVLQGCVDWAGGFEVLTCVHDVEFLRVWD